MTNKQAIEALERLFSDSTDENYVYCEEFGEAVSVAIEELRKQTLASESEKI